MGRDREAWLRPTSGTAVPTLLVPAAIFEVRV
jgi:hypothetical protein